MERGRSQRDGIAAEAFGDRTHRDDRFYGDRRAGAGNSFVKTMLEAMQTRRGTGTERLAALHRRRPVLQVLRLRDSTTKADQAPSDRERWQLWLKYLLRSSRR